MKIKIEVADTPQTLSTGLMFREKLGSNEGMLFKFPMAVEANFWGKNTYIPLDIAFINNKHEIAEINSIVPLSTKQIRSQNPCCMALETNAGFFDKHGVKIGTKVKIIKDHSGRESELELDVKDR